MTNKVKIGDHVFEVTFDKEGKIVGQILPPEQVAEEALLKDGLEFDEGVVGSVVKDAWKQVEESIRKNIKEVVIKAIGFNNSWGKWEVDHCNGRMSSMGNLLANEATNLLLKEGKVVCDTIIADKEVMRVMREAIAKDFMERLRDYSAREHIRKAADTHLHAMVQDEIQKQLRAAKPVVKREVKKHLNSKMKKAAP